MEKSLGSWKNAPLVLVCAEIEFEKRASLTKEREALSELQANGAYPNYRNGMLRTITIRNEESGTTSTFEHNAFYEFSSLDNKLAFRLTDENLIFYDANYEDNFDGFLSRFLTIFRALFAKVPDLRINKARLRTFDIAVLPSDAKTKDWVKTEWLAGNLPSANSHGIAIRDNIGPDSSQHIRVRNGLSEVGKKISIAPNFDVPVSLRKDLVEINSSTQTIFIVDIEQSFNLANSDEITVRRSFKEQHDRSKKWFTSIFTRSAIKNFKGQ